MASACTIFNKEGGWVAKFAMAKAAKRQLFPSVSMILIRGTSTFASIRTSTNSGLKDILATALDASTQHKLSDE